MQMTALMEIWEVGVVCRAGAVCPQFLLSISFSAAKLIFLVLWFYLCMYCVQQVQFSELVSRKYKAAANVITLFAGPILLLVLVTIDTIKRSSAGEETIFEVIKDNLEKMAARVFKVRLPEEEKEESSIRLFDSSGRNIHEIYGHGDGRHCDSKVLDLTERIVTSALEQRASDILIDPVDEATYRIRFRIDGVLRVVKEFNAETSKSIVNSIKAVSSMDISEKRRPQDGAFMAKMTKSKASFRVASSGVLNGEKLSIRVLSQQAGTFKLSDLGLSRNQYSLIKHAVDKPSGMIVMCGPTGSGKTTTLYAMLNEMDRYTRNVVTVEDPIEAELPESSQIEINPKADITFAKALRSILRQDPDVICVGEIRDEETAEIALRASQTGHLVLATIHSNSNASALIRLMDLGVSPMMLASGLSMLISQRLVRCLCEDCKIEAVLNERQVQEFERRGIDTKKMFEVSGCRKCNETGYLGRTAIYDILELSEQLKAEITGDPSLASELRREGDRKGLKNLRKEGLKKMVAGITSIDEVKRVVG